LPQGLNLLPIQGHQGGIGQAPEDGLLAVLASQERAESFTNDDDTNKMFERQYGEGWALTV